MAEEAAAANWRDRVRAHDEAGHEAMVGYIGHVTGKEDIPEVYRELILFSVAAGLRAWPSMRTHGGRALAGGATSGQLLQALQLAALTGGFSCLIEGMGVVDELTGE